MKRSSRFLYLLPAAALVLGVTWLQNDIRGASAVGPAADTSADSGKAVYEQHCLACHAAEGLGTGKYPSLVSDQAKKGVLKSYDKAYAFISRNMPNNNPGSLRDEEYKAVTKYVLGLNGIPADYSDVASHWASKEILALDDKRYIDGYIENGRLLFKPDQPITRAEFIRYFVKAKEWYLTSKSDTDLTDVQKIADKVYILTAVEYGLIQGYPDHTFRPKNPITRAEISAVLARSELLRASGSAAFQDVQSDYWAANDIAAVQEAKLFGGYEDGTFRPERKMTRAEAVSVIYRLLNPS